MEGPSPEASKRQRLDSYNVSHRLQQQPPTSQSHGYSGHTLPPPNSYVQLPPIPQSPYHEAPPHEHRNLPDPVPHGYTHSHSGHNTPIRDSRAYPSDAGYSRRGSASGTTRSPDEYPQYAAARNLSSSSSEAQHFPPQHLEHAVHLSGYPPSDGPLNGSAHHGLPMSNYNEQNYPIAQGHAPEYSQSPVNAGPHPYGGPGYGASPGYHPGMQRPKKGNRAQQACDVCRAKKAKCDEQRPECGTCREARVACNYQTVVPAKADRANQAILDQLAAQKQSVESVDGRLERIEQILSNLNSAKPATGSGVESPDIKPVPRHLNSIESPKRRPTTDQKITPYVLSQQARNREQRTVDTSPSGSHITTSTDSTGGDIGMLRDSGVGVIPAFPVAIEHSTAAHRLLRWPSISALVKQSKPVRQVREDYVMEHEELKGVLRVYGRGEGKDYLDGGQPGAASPATSSTSGRSEETAEARSPASPPEGLWGTDLDSPTNLESRITSSIGGLGPGKNHLKLDPKTLRQLLQSYLDNIHILHPFLDKGRLTRMVERFSLRYNPFEQSLTKMLFSGPATFSTTFDRPREPSMAPHRVGKRKLSDGHSRNFIQEPGTVPHQPSPTITPEKSPANAIVLLVMALGKICEWKEALPGPVSENSGDTPVPLRTYTSSRAQTDSPPLLSLRHSSTSSLPLGANISAPSPMHGARLINLSPRSSADESSNSTAQRNIDVIPGLAYYAKATDILGNVHGGTELVNVQANLLAGLYAGQLARTFESWGWIHSACRVCRYLVRDPTLARERDLTRKDLIKFAFWTCSQLEGDILAELDLPPSGIQNIEMEYPKGFTELADFDNQGYNVPGAVQKMMSYYSFQIHIRNSLNNMQKDLHPPENRERKTDFFNMRNIHNESLMNWRNVLPPWLQWKDEDDPASDINDARLRAKYYGALYIIHRPFLRIILDSEITDKVTDSPQSDVLKGALQKPLAYSAHSQERSRGTMLPPRSTSAEKNSQAEILHSATTCIKAAIRSTVAFDNIISQQRLIVTNIFGTAHAQFGNILVLAATYKSQGLSFLVPPDQLEYLFDRTITFLRSLRPISSTLAQDAMILESLRQVIFEPPNLSFSSVDN